MASRIMMNTYKDMLAAAGFPGGVVKDHPINGITQCYLEQPVSADRKAEFEDHCGRYPLRVVLNEELSNSETLVYELDT